MPLGSTPMFQVSPSYLPRVVSLEMILRWKSRGSDTNTPVASDGPSLKTVIVNLITSSTFTISFVTFTSLVILKSVRGRAVKLCAESMSLVIFMSLPSPVTQTVLVIGPI